MPATIIAVANQKGGVGKTTASVNLAHILSDTHRVLLVDNDPQGNATKCFVQERISQDSDTLALYSENPDDPVAPLVIKEQLGLLGTHIHLAAVAERTFEVIFDFRTRIQSLRDHYDIILIDCLPSFGYLLNAALISSDFILVPIEMDIFALDGLSDLINSVERIRNRHNHSLRILGILPNKVHGAKTRNEKDIEAELNHHYGRLLLDTQITLSTKIPESHVRSRSITQHAPDSQQAIQYQNLTQELLTRMAKMGVSP